MRLALLLLLVAAPVAAQQRDTTVTITVRRNGPSCKSDSTTELVKQLLANKPTTVDKVLQWAPLAISTITLIAVLATRPQREPVEIEDEEPPHKEHK